MENEKDRFYVNLQNDTIEWMYYNPDSNTGGQFVLCKISYKEFYEGLKEFTNPEDLFLYLESICKQYLFDDKNGIHDTEGVTLYEKDYVCEGADYNTVAELDYLHRAKYEINEYCMQEFGSKANFENLQRIGLAYTTTETGNQDIQAYADLYNYRIFTELDNKVVVMNQYRNISEMFHKGLTNLTFDGLISIPDKYDRDTTDIHDLAERMVYFMKDYDHYEYMDTLEIDETDADAIESTFDQLANGFYDIPELGEKEKALEFFFQKIETQLSDLLKNLLNFVVYEKVDRSGDRVYYEPSMRAELCGQFALLIQRTDMQRKQIHLIYEQLCEGFPFIPVPAYDKEDFKRLHNNQILDLKQANFYTNMFENTKWAVLVNHTDLPFWTSDNPIISINHGTQEHISATSDHLTYYIPISPKFSIEMYPKSVNWNDLAYFDLYDERIIANYNKYIEKECTRMVFSNKEFRF